MFEFYQKDLYRPYFNKLLVKRSTRRKLDTLEPTDEDQALLNRVIGFYHETLLQNPEALAYLEQRRLNDRELIARFKLGYANRTLAYRLPEKQYQAGRALRTQLQRLGILRESGHEHLNGSLVIPIFDEQNNVLQAYGRKIHDDLRKGTPKHLYLPGPHRGVFNLDGLKDTEEVILCEALIDALTFWKAGYRNVTTSYGVHGFTEAILAAIKAHNIQRVLIAYDRDAAGNTAAVELAQKLNAENIGCYRILFPKGMDANAYALQVQPASKSLGVAIRSAEWMGQGKAPDIVGSTKSPGAILNSRREARSASPRDGASNRAPATNLSESPAKRRFEEQAKTISEHMRKMEHPPMETTPENMEPLPARVEPEAPKDVDADVAAHEITFAFGDRRYRVRGLEKNTGYEILRVNLLASRAESLHVDTFDLYSAKHRQAFIAQASAELGIEENILKTDLGKVLLKLELLQAEQLRETGRPETKIELTDPERQSALALLKSPDLLNRILQDVERSGLVGENTNALAGYLACVSRKLNGPLAIIVQSTSAAGKSSLMDAVLALMPEEDRVQYSAMTGQSLFYMGETNLKHKILAIAEEEGAAQASYALKLLQSEGELTIASTAKDPQSGRLETQEYRVEGPVMLFLTTTAIEIDDELLNRCLVLTVNEDREQTQAIHRLQRKKRTLDGLLLKQDKKNILALHRNAQRLLKPLHVVNPFAEQLTFLDDKTRTRRDHEKYLTLIDSIALLHQYQRTVQTVTANGEAIEYIEVTLDDIAIANRLAHEILGRTLDELPPQTRRLLKRIHALVRERCEAQGIEQKDVRFSRREVRDFCGWGDTQLRVHLDRLVSMEYVIAHRGARGQSYLYELLYDGQGEDGQTFLHGLIDVQALQASATTESSRGETHEFAGSSRPHRGGNAGRSRDAKNGKTKSGSMTSEKSAARVEKSTSPAENNTAVVA